MSAEIRFTRNKIDVDETDVSSKWLGANEYFANDTPREKCHLLLTYKLGVYSTNSVFFFSERKIGVQHLDVVKKRKKKSDRFIIVMCDTVHMIDKSFR